MFHQLYQFWAKCQVNFMYGDLDTCLGPHYTLCLPGTLPEIGIIDEK